jgi:hypothetical protein
MPVHHIEVQKIRAAAIDIRDLIGQSAEISREDGCGDLGGCGLEGVGGHQ